MRSRALPYNRQTMRFVTHCPSCGTSFKVVADQLRIAQGWVRCGQCQAVYKAVDTLMPAASDAPQEDAAPPPPTALPPADAAPAPSAAAPDARPAEQPAPVEAPQPAEPATNAAWSGAPDPQEVARQHQSTLARIAAVIAAKKALLAQAAAEPEEPGEPPAQAAAASDEAEQDVPVAPTAQALPIEPPPPVADATPPPPSDDHAASVPAVDASTDTQTNEQAAAPSATVAAAPLSLPELPAQTSGLVTLLPDGAWQFSPLVEAPPPQPEAHTALAAAPSVEPVAAAAPELSAASGPAALPKRSSRSEAERRARHERRARRAAEKAAALAGTALSKEELSQQAREALAARSLPSQEPLAPPDVATAPVDVASAVAADLSFVRAAQRRAFWQRPSVRSALVLTLVLGLVTLAGQWLFYQRASLYARIPLARLVLDAACRPLNCRIAPWQNIHAVEIESSEFLKNPDESYALHVALRNSSLHPVAMPALELSLLDADQQLVARRVIAVDPAVPAPPVLPARGQWNVDATVDVRLPADLAQRDISGYRLTVFYP